jgi:polysaccharide export outer membrane protein
MTIMEAEELLTQKFSQFFTQPKVALSVLEKTSIKVILYGEVSRIGVFPVKPNTTIAEFIIEKGGTTPDADITRIAISRNDGSKIIFDMERYLYSNEPINNVVLKDKDKIIVPRKVQGKYGKLSKNYILQYGNVLEISINEMALMETNPTRSESYIVDSEGNIFHRLFGSVHLGGITVDKAQGVLTEMAKQYYREPVVSVDVIELSSRNVFVFGEVVRPGIYPIEGNIRLAEFLANIGGMTDAADLREIVVTRKQGKPVVFDMNDFLFKRNDRRNIFLEDGDRIIVQKRQRGIFVKLSEKLQPLSTLTSLLSSILMIYLYTTATK